MIPQRMSARKIEDLIVQYRNGDRKAGETLLEQFRPLIGKYMNLFLRGVFRENDADILKFLKCCGHVDKDSDYYRVAKWIKHRFQDIDKEDIEQICKVALLQTACDYMNIAGSYKFTLLKYIRNVIEDIPTVYINIEESDILPPYYINTNVEALDEDWISGKTAGEGFALLTKRQREILLLTYENNWPDTYIMQRLKISRKKLVEERQAIKETLQKELNLKTNEKSSYTH